MIALLLYLSLSFVSPAQCDTDEECLEECVNVNRCDTWGSGDCWYWCADFADDRA
jgi:hypothetical protein